MSTQEQLLGVCGISSNLLLFDYIFVSVFFQEKFLYIPAPPLYLRNNSSELCERLLLGLYSPQ